MSFIRAPEKTKVSRKTLIIHSFESEFLLNQPQSCAIHNPETDISEASLNAPARVFCTRCNFERFIFINSTNCRQLRFIRQPETSFEWAERTFCSLSKPLENCRLPPHPSPDLIISHCPRVDKLLTGKLYCAFPLKRSLRVEDVAINGVIMVFFYSKHSRRGYLSGRGISQRQTNDLMEFSEIFLDHLHLSSLKIDSP